MIHRVAFEDMPNACYYELKRSDPPGKTGWHLVNTETGEFLAGFYLPHNEPFEIASRRAFEHARTMGFRPTKIPNTTPDS